VTRTHPAYLANQPVEPNHDLAVVDKYRGDEIARVPLADAGTIDRAIEAAVAASAAMRRLAPDARREILLHAVACFHEREDDLAQTLCREAGKPIRDSRGEVARLIDTFRLAAEEAIRPHGEALELQVSPRARGYRGFTQRVPVGPCSFIAPFNFPLNLAAHKIAPAIAAGCPFVLKPASRTPLGALLIGEVLAQTALPPGAFSILPCRRDAADALTEDQRLKLLSFTGSQDVGWDLKARAGKKKVVLELGGNAACIVDAEVDLDAALPRLLTGAYYQSGQSCISVQRIIVDASLADALTRRLVAGAEDLVAGDPADETTTIGPMIAESEAERLAEWIDEAIAGGAELLCGGRRDGALFPATVLRAVPRDCRLYREEAFGPVVLIESVPDFDAAIERVNDSRFGIHAGVFTPRIDHALRAWDELEVGGVLVNEVPSWRVDHMPYGGVKDSGLGREGLRYAIEDMTEIRSLVFRHQAD